MIKLNDGIFHPMYNPNGWRMILKDGNSYIWSNDEVAGMINSQIDCYRLELLSKNGESGRPDGLVVLNNDAVTSIDYGNITDTTE